MPTSQINQSIYIQKAQLLLIAKARQLAHEFYTKSDKDFNVLFERTLTSIFFYKIQQITGSEQLTDVSSWLPNRVCSCCNIACSTSFIYFIHWRFKILKILQQWLQKQDMCTDKATVHWRVIPARSWSIRATEDTNEMKTFFFKPQFVSKEPKLIRICFFNVHPATWMWDKIDSDRSSGKRLNRIRSTEKRLSTL